MAQKLPYSDGAMIYNSTEHRYILTPDYVKNALNVDLEVRLNSHGTSDRATLAQNYLSRISREVYTWIYAHNNQLILEYYLAKSETARHVIQAAMEEQVLYWLANGDPALMTGVDSKRGAYADRRTIRGSIISPIAEGMLENTILPETGCALTYTGYYGLRTNLPKYEEEDY